MSDFEDFSEILNATFRKIKEEEMGNSEGESTETPATSENKVESVSSNVKLPPFWVKSPSIWFKQVESIFALNNIKAQSTRYFYLVSSLPSEVLEKVEDIISDSSLDKNYDGVKNKILSRLTFSEEERINKLLYGMEIGDSKPSELYRKIKSIAGDSAVFSDTVIDKLWQNRLPKFVNCSLQLLSNKSTDERLAIADTIFETSKSFQIFELSKFSGPSASDFPSTPSTSLSVPLNNLEQKCNKLESEISEIKNMLQGFNFNSRRPRSHSRNRQNFRYRSNSRPRNNGLCFYHDRYGKFARSCRDPCKWVDKKSKPSDSNLPKNK